MGGDPLVGFVLALQLLWLFSDAEIKINSPQVPSELASTGFGSEAIKEMLRNDLRTVVLNSGGAHPTLPSGIVERNLAETVAEILHLEASVHAIRSTLGQVTHELSIEFVQINKEHFIETSLVTLPTGPIITELHSLAQYSLFEALDEVAKWVILKVDPLTLAKFELREAQYSGDYSEVSLIIQACRRFYSAEVQPMIDNIEGIVGLGTGEFAMATDLFEFAMLRDPGFDEARLNHAVAIAASGEREQARALLMELSTPPLLNFWGNRDPIRAAALALEGLVAAHEGQLEEAVELMRRGIAVEPEMPELHRLLAHSLNDIGLTALARLHGERAQQLIEKGKMPLPRAILNATVLRQALPPDLEIDSVSLLSEVGGVPTTGEPDRAVD